MRSIRVPGDKSISQRALILAALADGESRLKGVLAGADPQSTAGVLRALGADVPAPPEDGSEIRIRGVGLHGLRKPAVDLDFGNSGTGARLMMGVLAAQGFGARLIGDASLSARPMRRVSDPLELMGASFEWETSDGRLPALIRGGNLRSIEWKSPVASAQVKSAVLLAGLCSGAPVTVVEPRRSRDHSERMLGAVGAGLRTGEEDGGWAIRLDGPPRRLRPLDWTIPGDPSSAAFFAVLAALGGAGEGLRLANVGLNPTRTGFIDVLRRMGVPVSVPDRALELPWEPVGEVVVEPAGTLRGTEIGGAEIPSLIDELPVLAVLASRAEGTTRITGAAELRVKETDRIRAMVDNLRAVGVEVEEFEDGMEIRGGDHPLSGTVQAHHDHRIAMSFGVLGALPGNSIEIDDPSVVEISFPGFWELLAGVGTDEGQGGGDTDTPAVSKEGPVVTLDGPAGSGKSSTARAVADRLGYRHLDSGALYRAMSYGLLRAGVPRERWSKIEKDEFTRLGVTVRPVGPAVEIHLGPERLTHQLRTAEVTAVVSTVAQLPAVRGWLLDIQRRLGEFGRLVADGRDMGSVVFPDADLKVFLEADLNERARRRLIQDGTAHPTDSEIEAEAARIEARDRTDSEREHSPLMRPEGATNLDTTALDFGDQVDAIVRLVEAMEKQPG